jgi:hypothetical protein
LPFSLLNQLRIQGDENGTRTSALAARRAYTGDPSALVILRTLIDNEEFACRKKQDSAMIGGVIFSEHHESWRILSAGSRSALAGRDSSHSSRRHYRDGVKLRSKA